MDSVQLLNSDALFCLGDMYFYGLEGIDKDYQKAFEYFNLAGKNGW